MLGLPGCVRGTASQPSASPSAGAAAGALAPAGAPQARETVAPGMPTVPPDFARRTAASPAALRPPPASPEAQAAAPPPAASSAPGAPGAPVIYDATISPAIVHNGEAMTWAVRTAANVVSVTAHVSMYTLPLRRDAPGRFSLSFTVPAGVPGIFHGSYTLNIVAADAAGATATRTLPLVFQ